MPHLFIRPIEKRADIRNELAKGLPIQSPCGGFFREVETSYAVITRKHLCDHPAPVPNLRAGGSTVQWLENANVHGAKLFQARSYPQWVESGH